MKTGEFIIFVVTFAVILFLTTMIDKKLGFGIFLKDRFKLNTRSKTILFSGIFTLVLYVALLTIALIVKAQFLSIALISGISVGVASGLSRGIIDALPMKRR